MQLEVPTTPDLRQAAKESCARASEGNAAAGRKFMADPDTLDMGETGEYLVGSSFSDAARFSRLGGQIESAQQEVRFLVEDGDVDQKGSTVRVTCETEEGRITFDYSRTKIRNLLKKAS